MSNEVVLSVCTRLMRYAAAVGSDAACAPKAPSNMLSSTPKAVMSTSNCSASARQPSRALATHSKSRSTRRESLASWRDTSPLYSVKLMSTRKVCLMPLTRVARSMDGGASTLFLVVASNSA